MGQTHKLLEVWIKQWSPLTKWKCLRCPADGKRRNKDPEEVGMGKSFTKAIGNVLRRGASAAQWLPPLDARDYGRTGSHRSGLINIHGDDGALGSHEMERKMRQEWRIRRLTTVAPIKSQNPFLNSLT